MGINLPLGIDSFAKLREENFYYVDKTAFIRELLEKQFEARLVTRPRRFGKTLTMSMLEDFFDIGRDSRAHFKGLKITEETELCSAWMNQWPVLFVSLKKVEGLNFASAYGRLAILISELCKKYSFLGKSERVTPADREIFHQLDYQEANDTNLADSLLVITRMLSDHYGKQVILLVDEYDVPLAKASENGYYTEMLDTMRALLGGAVKSNPYLKFAVITGCLRISKESIFTGLNNLVTDSIIDGSFQEYIGFTPREVEQLLADTGFPGHAGEVKAWYDGYRFGKAEIYCPWSVLNYLNALQDDGNAKPRNYWANTSGNSIIYRFISRTDLQVNDKFEALMAGEAVITRVEENLTYDMLYSTEENLWSLLYLTGYLTAADDIMTGNGVMAAYESMPEESRMALRIPNEEVKSVFKTAIIGRFQETIQMENREKLFEALWSGNEKKAQEMISNFLFGAISYHDYQESYYHTFLVGIFSGAGYAVESNYEYGTGRPDVVVKDRKGRRAMILEAKHARNEDEIPKKANEAVRQILERRYLEGIDRGYTTKLGYGVVFHEKLCVIVRAEEKNKTEQENHK